MFHYLEVFCLKKVVPGKSFLCILQIHVFWIKMNHLKRQNRLHHLLYELALLDYKAFE